MPNRMLPMYVKIADKIRNQIMEGELAPGSRLRNQRELAEEFKTTLMTVRQALEVLEQENLIRTEHGIGSFVVSPHVEENNFDLLGFSNEMGRRSLIIETRVLAIDTVDGTEEANRALLQPAEAALIKLERLRLLNGKPLVYQRSYLPVKYEGLIREYQPDISLYQYFHQSGGVVITTAREIIKSVPLDNDVAGYLERDAHAAAFVSYRVSFDRDGVPVIFDEAFLAADSFVIATERFGLRSSFQIQVLDSCSPDPLTLLMENDQLRR